MPGKPDVAYTVALPAATPAVRITIGLAMGLVGLSWICLCTAGQSRRWSSAARLFWTLGFACYAAHVAVAFATYHHWSHARAAWHTGYRTWEMTGWFWPGGIWINYLFTLLWMGDVIYWWSGLDRYARRPAWLRWFVHAFFAFMIFQAGVVFASSTTRWLTLAGLSIVGIALLLRIRRSPWPESP